MSSPFQWHSFAPFFELASALLCLPDASPSQREDLELLTSCVTMLREVAANDDPTTYCGNLLAIATTCLNTTTAFIEQRHQMLQALPLASSTLADTSVAPRREKRPACEEDDGGAIVALPRTNKRQRLPSPFGLMGTGAQQQGVTAQATTGKTATVAATRLTPPSSSTTSAGNTGLPPPWPPVATVPSSNPISHHDHDHHQPRYYSVDDGLPPGSLELLFGDSEFGEGVDLFSDDVMWGDPDILS